MMRDIRQTSEYQEAVQLYADLRRPGRGEISDAAELHVSFDASEALFTGTIVGQLHGAPDTRICAINLVSGVVRVLTAGPHTDRCPRYSPDGQSVAFLSDREEAGNFQAYLLEPRCGTVRTLPRVSGWIEYLHWSPDGRRLLMGVAGHGADVSGGQGAVASRTVSQPLPSWIPKVETGLEEYRWRTVWIYDLDGDRIECKSPAGLNIWEAVWWGPDAFAAVVSSGPAEGLWYSAWLCRVSLSTGLAQDFFRPAAQIGWPAASPSGGRLCVVEGLCSDRWIVSGDLRLIDSDTGAVRTVDTHGVDVTYLEWRSESVLLLAGHRSFETVVGLYEVASARFKEIWSSTDISTGGRYVTVSGLNSSGDCALIGEGFARAPEVALIRSGTYEPVRSLDLGYQTQFSGMGQAERVSWTAADGLVIQGWLVRPLQEEGPYATVTYIHGGPVWHWRPMWFGRSGASALMLLRRGYAIFLPNPRGSAGRGQSFVQPVVGDMGGADTGDFLSGLDWLVATGRADPTRLAIIGGSYGGFMAAWLITQDTRFAAAIPVVPITNWVSEHLVSNIPHWVELFLGDRYTCEGGKYFQRSPVMHAHKVRTPTLTICGALDRVTPPEEAVQFHNALLENNVESVLVTYPQEGHGVRAFEAGCDYSARCVRWFDRHLRPSNEH
jgi:dipeptidyl aminopeptidase/acylaminoacyl peptidase